MSQQILNQVKDAHAVLGNAIADNPDLPPEVKNLHMALGSQLAAPVHAINWSQVAQILAAIFQVLGPILNPQPAPTPAPAPPAPAPPAA